MRRAALCTIGTLVLGFVLALAGPVAAQPFACSDVCYCPKWTATCETSCIDQWGDPRTCLDERQWNGCYLPGDNPNPWLPIVDNPETPCPPDPPVCDVTGPVLVGQRQGWEFKFTGLKPRWIPVIIDVFCDHRIPGNATTAPSQCPDINRREIRRGEGQVQNWGGQCWTNG